MAMAVVTVLFAPALLEGFHQTQSNGNKYRTKMTPMHMHTPIILYVHTTRAHVHTHACTGL